MGYGVEEGFQAGRRCWFLRWGWHNGGIALCLGAVLVSGCDISLRGGDVLTWPLPVSHRSPLGVLNVVGTCFASVAYQLLEVMRAYEPQLIQDALYRGIQKNPMGALAAYCTSLRSFQGGAHGPHPVYKNLSFVSVQPLADLLSCTQGGDQRDVFVERIWNADGSEGYTERPIRIYRNSPAKGNGGSVNAIMRMVIKELREHAGGETLEISHVCEELNGSTFEECAKKFNGRLATQKSDVLPPFLVVYNSDIKHDRPLFDPPLLIPLPVERWPGCSYEQIGFSISLLIPSNQRVGWDCHVVVLIKYPSGEWFLCDDSVTYQFKDEAELVRWKAGLAATEYSLRWHDEEVAIVRRAACSRVFVYRLIGPALS